MVDNVNSKRRKRCNNNFIDMLQGEIVETLERKKQDVSIENVISYLIRHNIVRQSIVHRYVIIFKYPEYLEEYGSKQKAVEQMSKDYPLDVKGIYSILANHYAYFHPNKIEF
jgi:hypothetical protein